MLCKCWVSYLSQGQWKLTMLYLQHIFSTFYSFTLLAETNDTVFAIQKWSCALSIEWIPVVYYRSIIPLPVSALQAGGSSDCGRTAWLPVWMNCSKVMPCTKSLPGNKARQVFVALQRRQEFCLWTTSRWRGWRPHAAGVALLLIDHFWPVGDQRSPSHPPTP